MEHDEADKLEEVMLSGLAASLVLGTARDARSWLLQSNVGPVFA